MGTYDRQIKTALRLIKKKGVLCQWRKMIPTPGEDPANPGPGTPEDHPVYIAFFPNIQVRFGTSNSMIPNTDIPSGTFYGLMGAVDFRPDLVDTIISPQGTYGIIDKDGINELAPNGQTILYTIRVTR